MESFILSLFPEARREHIHHGLVEMAQAMGGYFRGAAINGIIIGLISFVGFLLIGIDFALAFGVMAGLLELVPIAGPIIATLIISGLTLLQSPGQALAVLIFMIVLQQIENNVLVPQVMRSQTDISRLLSILAVFAGGAIGGLLGALIAIPITAALRVLVLLVIAPAIRRQTGAEKSDTSAD
jgi:predicted PurR-regulated permease PerM